MGHHAVTESECREELEICTAANTVIRSENQKLKAALREIYEKSNHVCLDGELRAVLEKHRTTKDGETCGLKRMPGFLQNQCAVVLRFLAL